MTVKFCILLSSIFVIYYANAAKQPVRVLDVNGCALKYRKEVPDKPEIFINTVVVPGVCHLQKHQHESNENYEPLKVEYYRKESENDFGPWERGPVIPNTIQTYKRSNYQGLNYDVRTKSLIYVDRELKDKDYFYFDILVRRRFNDSLLIEEFALRDRYQQSVLKSEVINDLAYDWRTKNLYINSGKSISVINLNKNWAPVIVVSEQWVIASFAVHPNAGYLFYVVSEPTDKSYKPVTPKFGPPELYKGDYTSTIYRTYLDGSNKRQIGPIITHRDAFIDNLMIDYHTDRLYWNIPHMSVVQSSNFDGSDMKDVIHRELHHGLTEDSPRAISFDKKYVYYILANRTIRRLDKQSLKEDEHFEIYNEGDGRISDMVVYDPESRKITTDHPCLVDNGGCDQYCFAYPKDQSKQGPYRICRNGNA